MADAMHTPGPLTVQRAAGSGREGEVGILSEGLFVVAECYADIRRAGEQALDEAMANATLFAAAPELLRMLQAIVDRDFCYMDHKVHSWGGVISQRLIHEARVVIDRATGKAS